MSHAYTGSGRIRQNVDATSPRHPGVVVPVLLAMLLCGCGSSISIYDATAYKLATDLKAESLTLMEKAVEPATVHGETIDALRLDLLKALEYERGRPDNELSTRMWSILLDPNRNLLGGFLRRWEESGPLSSAFVSEARGQVGEAFDQIIGLEIGKLRPDEVQSDLFPGL